MDYIDEILFKHRDRVKKLITENKTGKKFAESVNIPFDRLEAYKKSLAQDMKYCTDTLETYTHYEEFKFRTSEQAAHPNKYRESIPIQFKDLTGKMKVITDQIKTLSKQMTTKKERKEQKLVEDKKLSISEELFIQHYLVTRNAQRAAEMAGFQGSSAGFDLQNRPHVQRAITMRLAEGFAKAGITVESVLSDLQVLRDRGMQAHPVVDQDGVFLGEWKFDSSTALKAVELMGKYLKMFSDRLEHTGKNGGPIQVQVEPKYDLSALTVEELEILKKLSPKIKIIPQKTIDADFKEL